MHEGSPDGGRPLGAARALRPGDPEIAETLKNYPESLGVLSHRSAGLSRVCFVRVRRETDLDKKPHVVGRILQRFADLLGSAWRQVIGIVCEGSPDGGGPLGAPDIAESFQTSLESLGSSRTGLCTVSGIFEFWFVRRPIVLEITCLTTCAHPLSSAWRRILGRCARRRPRQWRDTWRSSASWTRRSRFRRWAVHSASWR